MTNNEKWLNMMNIIKESNSDFIISNELLNGELVSKELLRDNKSWRLTIKFPESFSFAILNNAFQEIKTYMVNNFNAVDVRFTVIYDFVKLNKSLVDEYYKEAIKVLTPVNKGIVILNDFDYHLDENDFIVEVRSDSEKKIVNQLLTYISKFFENYGIKELNFMALETSNQMDAKAINEVRFESVDKENTAVAMENYYKNKVDQNSNEVMYSYSGYHRNGVVDVSIDDLPFTSIEVTEFEQTNGTNKVHFTGVICDGVEIKQIKTKAGVEKSLFIGIVTNYKDSITVKRFFDKSELDFFTTKMLPNNKVDILGKLQWDNFGNEVTVFIDKVHISGKDTYRNHFDGQEQKRVELHAHTKMSVLDSILNVEEYVEQAKRFNHKSLAVTDRENCHILPHFFDLCKKAEIKPIAGIEENYIDIDNALIAFTNEDINLKDATYVVFDIETTGFYYRLQEIIEIGAVKVKHGTVIDTFSEFVKPVHKIPDAITQITNITNDMVYDALSIKEVLPAFKEFIDGCILVGHNARFDTDYIYYNMKKLGIYEHDYPCIDTIRIARCLYAEDGLKAFNLGAVAKYLKVVIEQQHRAIHDARTTNNMFQRMLGDIEQLGITNYKDLNNLIDKEILYKYEIPTHITFLVKNKVGLKNLYKLISDANVNHFYKGPRVLKKVIEEYHEGILVGSSCANGEIFKAAIEKDETILRKKMALYDYIEVQPPRCYDYLFEKTLDDGWEEFLIDSIKMIIRVAKEEGKIVVATGDVHELISEDSEFRKIYLAVARPNGGGPHELNKYDSVPDMHFLSTTEMLKQFDFLPAEEALEIVVTNTNKIADMCEEYDLFPKDLFVPSDDFLKKYNVPSMKQAIIDLCDNTCKSIYGEDVPKYVRDRLDRELKAIIGHGYFSVYYISHLLVKNSNEHGYCVGSRGSVGSSFVATMMNITEVNPLVPHYNCPNCHFTAFRFNKDEKILYPQDDVPQEILDELEKHGNGYDLPPMKCPKCGHDLRRMGMDIAFETFLGFTGDKCPDIDLNFSGEYQADAHLFVQDMFGVDYSFRAGTVTAAAQTTAFQFTKDYYDHRNVPKRHAEITRLANFLQGSKRTTGQHPGGIVVVPNYMDIYDITPLQYPPLKGNESKEDLNWRTTHFEYHSFESNLLKLDILGQDNPTCIKMLTDYAKDNPDEFNFTKVEEIPFVDEEVLSLFSSKDALHLDGDDLDKFSSGTIGIPEFGTNFVRGMLETIKPKTYEAIIKVSGLSHGEGVWNGNAESLVKGIVPGYPKVEFENLIGCRDDIMIYLISMGVPAADSFKIMEKVRKKNGMPSPEQFKLMQEHGVPEWYIWTCKQITYLFPKAHASAYVIDALRIAWFKVHAPIYYYSVYFTVRAKEFDVEVMANGKNAVRNKVQELIKKTQERKITDKETQLLEDLQVALEMLLRGYKFRQIDIWKSEAKKFVVAEDKKSLYLPFVAIESLGETVAKQAVEERNKRPFTSVQDIEERKIFNKNQLARLKYLGVFDGMESFENNTLLSDETLRKLDL